MMTERDDLAKAAMQGMLAHSTRYRPRAGASDNWHDALAEEAYQIADAMLRASSYNAPVDAARHLLDRLEEWSEDGLSEDSLREWMGHVEPAIGRARVYFSKNI